MHSKRRQSSSLIISGIVLIVMELVTSQPVINIIHITEADNAFAQQAIRAAEAHLTSQWSNEFSVNIKTITAHFGNLSVLRDEVCQQHSRLLADGIAVHGILSTIRSAPLSLYVWLLAMHSQLPTVTVSYAIAPLDHAPFVQRIVDANASTACPCFVQMLQANRNMQEVLAPVEIVPLVIEQLVREMGMEGVAVLYDAVFESIGQYTLLLANTKARHVIRRLQSGNGLVEQIEVIRKMSIHNFFVLGSMHTIEWILSTLPAHFFTKHYLWTFVSHELGRPAFCPASSSYMLVTPHETAMPDIMSEAYFQMTIDHILSISEQLQSHQSLSTPIDCETNQLRSSTTEFYNHTDSTIIYADGSASSRQSASLNFTMNVRAVRCHSQNERNAEDALLATWPARFDQPLKIRGNLSALNAIVLYQVTAVLKRPFVMLDPQSPSGFSGYCIDLLDRLAATMGFQYNIQMVSDNKYGLMTGANGTWNGAVRELLEKRADIALGAMSVMAERETVVDFTVPYYDLVGIAIMMKIPDVAIDHFRFLSVMEREVWLSILVSYVLTSLVLWLTDRMSPFSYQNSDRRRKEGGRKKKDDRIFDLKDSFWFCLMSLTPQGGGRVPRSISSQCVVATWWLYGFIILASYTANLAAFLTVDRLDSDIEELDDLIDQHTIDYAPINGTAAWMYFERMAGIESRFYQRWQDMSMDDSLTPIERRRFAVWEYPLTSKYTKVWQHFQTTGSPRDLAEAVERVRNSTPTAGFAFIGDAADIQLLALENCDLRMVGEEFSRKPYAIAVQQGSPLKGAFDEEIVRLLSSRWLEKLKAKWWPRPQWQTGRCHNQPGHFDALGMDNIAGFVLLLVCGIGLAIVALIGEWMYYRRKRERQSQQMGEQQETEGPQVRCVQNVMLPFRNDGTMMSNQSDAESGSCGGPALAKARANVALCRQRRRRLSKSIAEEDSDPNAICVISSCDV